MAVRVIRMEHLLHFLTEQIFQKSRQDHFACRSEVITFLATDFLRQLVSNHFIFPYYSQPINFLIFHPKKHPYFFFIGFPLFPAFQTHCLQIIILHDFPQRQQIYYPGQSMRTSDFERTSPSRLFQRAANYTKHLGHYHDLPKNISKSMVVRQQAESQKDQIDFAIKRSEYQLELYRKKENDDMMRRTTFERKLNESAEKVAKNEKDIEAKKAKVAEEYEKHLRKTYRKYEDDEKRHRDNERQQAYKLRKDLKEFYEKEAARKKSAEFKQISVGTCYQSAVEKINNIHKRNQEYSLKAEEQLNKELQKNNHLEEIIKKKRRSVSSMNEAKSKIYDQNLTIYLQRQKSFIQKYGRNQDGSISAFKHIQSEEEKEKKRLKEFFKKRVEKWTQEKKRVDAAKAEISQKCTSILQRTNNSFFRQTVSSFRSTSKEWQKLVQRNKSAIKSNDQMKKDQIMDQHLDLRLRNTSSFKVSERMQSMKLQAKKLASDYL